MAKTCEKVLTVTEFNTFIKEVVSNLGIFQVRGEITELKISKNNGLFITVSDGKSTLRVGGYAPTVKGVDLVEEGMEVVVIGVADLYVPYGTFSLNALEIEPVGEGALAKAYEKLKLKLEKEGLFALEHKQELPGFITKIALLTGKDSAAYSDFIKILREQSVSIAVDYHPVLVQGKGSVEGLIKAMDNIQKTDVDLVVITRGGGSLEDLKGFNDEDLARKIFSSKKLVIAGVGHEKDESIADFVADLRASTPSQAAYYIAERNQEFYDSVKSRGDKINDLAKSILDERYRVFHDETLSVENMVRSIFEKTSSRIENLERILKTFDTESVLKRGYAILSSKGKRVRSVNDLNILDLIDTAMFDGVFTSTVNKIKCYTNEDDQKK